jgi:hypothetical protein
MGSAQGVEPVEAREGPSKPPDRPNRRVAVWFLVAGAVLILLGFGLLLLRSEGQVTKLDDAIAEAGDSLGADVVGSVVPGDQGQEGDSVTTTEQPTAPPQPTYVTVTSDQWSLRFAGISAAVGVGSLLLGTAVAIRDTVRGG